MKSKCIYSILLISIYMISIVGIAIAQEESMNTTKADGKTLYNYIIKENDYKKWKMWPGKGELYPGIEPHGVLLTTYVTDDTFSAIEARTGVLPYGAMIVKENYMPNKTLVAITVMYKEKDYDPKNNDWFWAKYMPNGTIGAEGKIQGCIDCHGQSKEKYGNQINDYIFTSNLVTSTPVETTVMPTIEKTEQPRPTPKISGFEGIIGFIILISMYIFRKNY